MTAHQREKKQWNYHFYTLELLFLGLYTEYYFQMKRGLMSMIYQ